MAFEFQTIKQPVADIIIREKGSKFIGFAFPVADEDEVRTALEKIRELHPKATHHCYAYRIGVEGQLYRANDDGEPSGSAGLPIYNQLLAHEITNVLVISVRYYGGTKLGVSGLVRTYKESAKETIEAAEIVTRELESVLTVHFNFEKQNVIFTLLNKCDAQVLDFTSDQKCSIKARIRLAEKENISAQLAEMHDIDFEIN
ncbi:YigZ family protein [Chryseobacterium salipaludis]|uniref:IMPACT family protein n=1 Tax=Chryseobacterium TaxID=59732 RepID=UPI001FF3AB53|nr:MULTISPECIES: YigZ family protein [Chryseobacterium]MCJ8496861.1 YigZ family protein [Chryseobacterium salipaludis]MCX3296342.1 YigZ family protein [Planobacterium sp. JC490]